MTRRHSLAGRESKFGTERDRQIRTEIAQTAARLVIEHGIDDWDKAKRKAARQLGVNEQKNLPSRDELGCAIREYNSLFRPESQAAMIRQRRTLALAWMKLLAEFAPRLTAGVATGLASEHSDVRIELVADDVKQVEFFLLGHELNFDPKTTSTQIYPQYAIAADDVSVRLVVIPPVQRRNLGRERLTEQLDISALEALLTTAAPEGP